MQVPYGTLPNIDIVSWTIGAWMRIHHSARELLRELREQELLQYMHGHAGKDVRMVAVFLSKLAVSVMVEQHKVSLPSIGSIIGKPKHGALAERLHTHYNFTVYQRLVEMKSQVLFLNIDQTCRL
jgi:hypothetical protein